MAGIEDVGARPMTRKPEGPRKLVDFKGLKTKYGIPFSRTHITRQESEGKFPKRVSIGAHRVAWVESEIDEWLAARIGSR